MQSVCPEGITSLQYADDILLFLKHDYMSACHLKWLLMCFEQLSGMKINYNKSDMVHVNLRMKSKAMLGYFVASLVLFLLST
jgi:hypothetical protein